MNDIIPPKRPLSSPSMAPKAPTPAPAAVKEEPLLSPPPAEKLLPAPKKHRRWGWWLLGGILALVVAAVAGCLVWYKIALGPVNARDDEKTRITIATGTSPAQIGELLRTHGLIRSRLAFDIYTRLTGARSQLQAGTYSLSPSESMKTIVDHITSGKTDQIKITFLPGATLAENKEVLMKAGYSQSEVDAAFAKTYSSPLFASKPSSADLEGYIYGETYQFDSSATVEDILTRTFNEYEKVITENNLIAGFQKQGLSLYQGITLSSIIQREVKAPADQRQVAQIFLKRLNEGMTLGSDVTAYYGADKAGLLHSVDTDTPYNTRIHPGLPPGPIGTPGLTALQAVANPASGDYLFFLSGDDGKTYYAHTDAEHEENAKEHCQIKCQAS